MKPKSVIVIGAGISGLASAALLAKAGHRVKVLEGSSWVGGKSRRIEVAGQRMDTGPALVTFPGVWKEFLRRYDSLGSGPKSEEVIDLQFEQLEEVGEYFFRGQRTLLPVEPTHPWYHPWQQFEAKHSLAQAAITELLTNSPFSPAAMKAVGQLARLYGSKLTTQSYLNSQRQLPEALREIISIHTLNAGVGPNRTLALYATMAAVMANQGVLVPKGGVGEIPRALEALAKAAGVEILLNQKVKRIRKGLVECVASRYQADLIVSSLDWQVTNSLLGKKPRSKTRPMSCSGIAIYAVLNRELKGSKTHSVIMPKEPNQLHEALARGELPNQSMVFVNYYPPGFIYPNQKPTVAVLITAAPDGKQYPIDHPFVQSELNRVSEIMGLEGNIQEFFEDYQILDPQYFSTWGASGGALYGEARRIWQSGPLHRPQHLSPLRPWLLRVGASTHPGGGIPAVLGGSLIATKAWTG